MLTCPRVRTFSTTKTLPGRFLRILLPRRFRFQGVLGIISTSGVKIIVITRIKSKILLREGDIARTCNLFDFRILTNLASWSFRSQYLSSFTLISLSIHIFEKSIIFVTIMNKNTAIVSRMRLIILTTAFSIVIRDSPRPREIWISQGQ